MDIRIDAPVQRSHSTCPQLLLQFVEGAPSGVAQNQIEFAEAAFRQVAHRLAVTQSRQCHRRIEVVKHPRVHRRAQDEIASRATIRAVRGDDADVCVVECAGRCGASVVPL